MNFSGEGMEKKKWICHGRRFAIDKTALSLLTHGDLNGGIMFHPVDSDYVLTHQDSFVVVEVDLWEIIK